MGRDRRIIMFPTISIPHEQSVFCNENVLLKPIVADRSVEVRIHLYTGIWEMGLWSINPGVVYTHLGVFLASLKRVRASLASFKF